MLKQELISSWEGTKHNETPSRQHCYVGKLTKPKVQRNLVASEPVALRDPSFLWVGFPLCGLLPADLFHSVQSRHVGAVLASGRQGRGQLSFFTGQPPSPHPFSSWAQCSPVLPTFGARAGAIKLR